MVAGGNCELGVRGYSGGLELRDMNNALDLCTIETVAGSITLASSCTSSAGSLSLKGVGVLQDNSTVVNMTNILLNPESIWSTNEATQVVSDVAFVRSIDGGKWELVGDQMVFYAADNVTEVARFNLFDVNGNATTTAEVFKRERV